MGLTSGRVKPRFAWVGAADRCHRPVTTRCAAARFGRWEPGWRCRVGWAPELPAMTMIDKDWTFVLGAQDPEMREIERVVADDGHTAVHAAKNRRRCNPKTAYEADSVVRVGPDMIPRPAVLPPKAPAVFVECTLRGHEPVARVDHHHPGDPGYEIGPQDYLRGSSLGQVLELLEREATDTQRLLAASDHCLTAAYQGACPGVDPGELLFLRASWRAKVSGRTLSDVIDGILDAARRVTQHHDSEFGESRFFDPTELPLDLAEGAAYAGLPVRYRELLPEGVLKEMFKGGTPEAVQAFMDEHLAAGRPVYGNPYRGYAGTYWPGRSAPGTRHLGGNRNAA